MRGILSDTLIPCLRFACDRHHFVASLHNYDSGVIQHRKLLLYETITCVYLSSVRNGRRVRCVVDKPLLRSVQRLAAGRSGLAGYVTCYGRLAWIQFLRKLHLLHHDRCYGISMALDTSPFSRRD